MCYNPNMKRDAIDLIEGINETLRSLSVCYDPEEIYSELMTVDRHRECFSASEDIVRGDPDKLMALPSTELQNIAAALDGMLVDLDLAASSAPMYFSDF